MAEQFLEALVKNLVDNPDKVSITAENQPGAVKYRVHVAPEDNGKVIGKGGRIANAIRMVTKAMSNKDRRRVFVEIRTEDKAEDAEE